MERLWFNFQVFCAICWPQVSCTQFVFLHVFFSLPEQCSHRYRSVRLVCFGVLWSPLLVVTFFWLYWLYLSLFLRYQYFRFVGFFLLLLRRDPLSLTGMIGNCIIRKLKTMYQKHQFHRRRPNFWWLWALTYVRFTKSPAGLRQRWVSIRPNNTTVLWIEIYCTLVI